MLHTQFATCSTPCREKGRRILGKTCRSTCKIRAWLERRMTGKVPLVVVVGGGFGGLAAAKALRRAPVNVLLIDKSNHHVFQPLLYQVATSVLAPSQIAAPLRGLLADQENTTVMLGDVTGIDSATRHVMVDAGDKKALQVAYDY